MRFKKSLATGVAALCAGSLMLTGCSANKSDNKIEGPKDGSKVDTTRLDINKKTREEMEKGGTLRIPEGSIGGNFNTWHNDGNNVETAEMLSTMDWTGCFRTAPDGSWVDNKFMCESAKEEVKDGKQVITFKINKDAKFNDGTPMDVKMFQNVVKIINDPKSNPTYPAPYKPIESVEQGADDHEVVVKMKTVYEPWQEVVGGWFHPAINTPEVFNKGWIDKINNNWLAGPFKLADNGYDASKKSLIVIPNEKWWGDKPQLDQIVFQQTDTKATIQSFKNGQIDVTGAGNVNRYNQLKGAKDVQMRTGNRTSVFGLVINTKDPETIDPAIRKAMYQGLNRTALADIRFKGLDWKEPKPGSWIAMPFSKHYKDNYPVGDGDPEGAKKTLQEAGYTLGSDGMFTKGGKPAQVSILNFGDDPMGTALIGAMQSQLKKAGIKVTIDQRADAAFNDAMAKRDWAVVFMGYTVGADATGAPSQFFLSKDESNMTGCGTAELDKEIADVQTMTDAEARNAKAVEIEGKWQKECYGMLPLTSGPAISAVNKYLANFGPNLFERNARDWTMIGWEKGHLKK